MLKSIIKALPYAYIMFTSLITLRPTNVIAKALPAKATEKLINDCNIFVFSEVHFDAAPVKQINIILKDLVTTNKIENPWGVNTLFIEEASDTSPEKTQKILENLITSPNVSPENKENFKSTVKLMTQARELDVQIANMDLPGENREKLDQMMNKFPALSADWIKSQKIRDDIRDEFMANQISSSCESSYGGAQIVLVGSFHAGGLERELKKLEHNKIMQIFVIDHQPIKDISLPEDMQYYDLLIRDDIDFRQKHGLDNVNVINLYKNPQLNATEEILRIFDINGFSIRPSETETRIVDITGNTNNYCNDPWDDDNIL